MRVAKSASGWDSLTLLAEEPPWTVFVGRSDPVDVVRQKRDVIKFAFWKVSLEVRSPLHYFQWLSDR